VSTGTSALGAFCSPEASTRLCSCISALTRFSDTLHFLSSLRNVQIRLMPNSGFCAFTSCAAGPAAE